MIAKLKAFVAAGGTGSRLGFNRPKSCIYFKGHTLGYWTALSLHLSGIEEIYIFVNDRFWGRRIKKEVQNIPGTKVIIDKGYENTFLLFQDYVDVNDSYIFTYGHTPHPPSCFQKIISDAGRIVISNVIRTSKKQPIEYSGKTFIEPPYLICNNTPSVSNSYSWGNFFELNSKTIDSVLKLPINEFNYLKEWLKYRNYLKSRSFRYLYRKAL